MSDRAQLFIGRLVKDVRTRDLEDIFSRYGKMTRCEIKHGNAMNYAFVDYEDRRDAEDCIRHENGREICGGNIVVEWSQGPNYRFNRNSRRGYYDEYARRSPRSNIRPRSRDRRRRSRSYERQKVSGSYGREMRRRTPSRTPSRSISASHSRSRSPMERMRKRRSPHSLSASPRANGQR